MNFPQRTIWNFFILKHRFTSLIILIALLLGTISIIQIPKESTPEVDIPFVVVNTVFPGASAEDVEELVTNIIEDKILGTDGVKKVSSTSGEGFSSIAIEFDPAIKGRDQKDKIQDKVDGAKVDLPEEAKDPVVWKVDISEDPILIFSLSGPYDTILIKKFAEELKDNIEKISGVSKVTILGGQEREVQVIVNKASLDRYRLSIVQVTNAIRQANADIPIGSIETAGVDYTVRLAGRLLDAKEVETIAIASVNNVPVLVRDVGEVIDGYKERKSISRLSIDGKPSLSSVTINVSKVKGGNIIRLNEKINRIIKEAQVDFLPQDINMEVFLDMAQFIREDLNQLVSSGFQTILLVFLLLYLFIGTKEAIIASLAVPFSFLITFIFLSVFGFTLNFLSLFSLILALGVLIDTAIVIIERMNVYINVRGKAALEAAILTVHEFQWPLIVGTLTTVFAFVPMLLMSGIMGQFMKIIPITVTIVLLSSLFVGLAIIPTLASRILKANQDVSFKPKGLLASLKHVAGTSFFSYLIKKYKRALTLLIDSKRKQRNLAIIVIVLFVLSLSLPITGVLKMNMFPSEDADLFFIEVKKPISTSLEETSDTVAEIENIILKDPQIKSFTVSVGDALFFGGTGENLAEIVVNLKKEREDRSPDIIDNYQRIFDQSIDAEVSTIQLSSGPPSAAPVDIGVRGDDLIEIESLVFKLRDMIKEIPGAVNVQTSVKESKGEFVITIDRAKAQLYGISTIELAQILHNAVQGTTATVIRYQGEETDVVVKYALNSDSNGNQGTNSIDINTLEALTIATQKGDIPLGAFTTTKLGSGRPSINHEEGRRTFRVTSYTESGVAPIEIINVIKEKMSSLNVPDGYEIVFGGEQEDLEQSYADMFRAMILAVFLIAGILILQFGSYRQPLFILATIPLSFIGIFPGLMLIGSPLSLPAIIGVVALAGIVVNNGIILIDMINKNRRANMMTREAVIEACSLRFRPIILTTITTIVGILPITLSSELWGGLGFTIIFGLAVSAALTLFIVPTLYIRFAEKELGIG